MPKNNQPATKGDIQLLKGDIKVLEKTLEKKLKGEIALVRLDMKDMEQRLDEKNKRYKDEILTKIDSFAGKTEALEQENAAGNLRLQDHEERITRLEAT